MSDGHPDLNVTEARQGRRGRHVLMILIISLGLVIIAFAAIWFMNAGRLGAVDGSKEAEAPAAAVFNAPEPAPKQDDTGAPPSAPATQAAEPEVLPPLSQ